MATASSPLTAAVRTTALLGLAILVTCCGPIPAPQLVASRGQEPWWMVKSSHFSLRTSVGDAEAKAMALDLERIYRTLLDLGFPLEKDVNLQTNVIVLRNEEEYNAIGPASTNGFFRPAAIGEIEGTTFVTYGGISKASRETFVHELTHRFVHYVCPQAPVWFNEGLAGYYQTIAVEGGKAFLGRTSYRFTRDQLASRRSNAFLVDFLPSFSDLTAMDAPTFYAARKAPAGFEGQEARRKQSENYASAWAVVHVLKNGPERYRERLDRWIVKMAEGDSAQEAYHQAFGDLPPNAIENDRQTFLDAISRRDITVLSTDYDVKADEVETARVEARTLSPADVHMLWAHLSAWRGRDGMETARLHVDAALASDPSSIDAHLVSARLSSMAGDDDAWAREILETGAKNSDDERAVYRVFMLHIGRRRSNKPTADRVASAEAILAKWLPRARSATVLNSFAWYMSLHGRAVEAVPVARRSTQADPSCAVCFDTLALALFRAGEFKSAVSAQEMSVALLGERDGASEFSDWLELLRSAWAAIVIWKKSAAPGDEALVLPASVIQAVRSAQQPRLKECYQEGWRRNRKLAGAVVLRGEIGPDGKVSKVLVVPADQWGTLEQKPTSAPLVDEEVSRCLVEQVGAFRFPPSSEPTPFALPVTFSPARDAPKQ